MRTIRIFAIILFTSFSVLSCTEEIEIDYNDFETKLVIEGEISVQAESTIRLSKTVNFAESNTFPAVSGAVVEISDNEGNKTLLQETEPGVYSNPDLVCISGKEYSMLVASEGTSYNSTCLIPNLVPLDSVQVRYEEPDNMLRSDKDMVFRVYAYYNDPLDEVNFYQFIEYHNGKRVRSFVAKDERNNGLLVKKELKYDDRELKKGDVVRIEMRSISESVYEYFDDLNSSSRMSATPANPRTNIENGTLGYFSAHASSYKSATYQ